MSELRRAIDGNQLLLHYQPKLQIATNRVCGSEALVSSRGLRTPL